MDQVDHAGRYVNGKTYARSRDRGRGRERENSREPAGNETGSDGGGEQWGILDAVDEEVFLRHVLNLTDEQIDAMSEWEIEMLPRRYVQTKIEIYSFIASTMIGGGDISTEGTVQKMMTSEEADAAIKIFGKLSGGKNG